MELYAKFEKGLHQHVYVYKKLGNKYIPQIRLSREFDRYYLTSYKSKPLLDKKGLVKFNLPRPDEFIKEVKKYDDKHKELFMYLHKLTGFKQGTWNDVRKCDYVILYQFSDYVGLKECFTIFNLVDNSTFKIKGYFYDNKLCGYHINACNPPEREFKDTKYKYLEISKETYCNIIDGLNIENYWFLVHTFVHIASYEFDMKSIHHWLPEIPSYNKSLLEIKNWR